MGTIVEKRFNSCYATINPIIAHLASIAASPLWPSATCVSVENVTTVASAIVSKTVKHLFVTSAEYDPVPLPTVHPQYQCYDRCGSEGTEASDYH